MPRGRRLLEKAFVKTQKAKQDIIEYIPGILGFYLNGSEIVKVPNREGYVFVRIRNNLSEVVKAYNDDVPPIFDLPVYIFRDPKDKRKWRISGKNVGTYREWNDDPYLPQHGEKHSFRGGDVTWIYSEQLLPLMALPSGTSTSGGLLVHGRYPYYWNNEWKYFSTTGTANLLDYKPTGTFNKTVLIYLDQSTNELGYEEGGYFAENITGAAQVVQQLPSLSENYYTPIAGVRLTSGTSSFTWDNLYDVRPWLNDLDNTTGSSSGHTIQEDGVNQTQRTSLNFIGDGFEVWDDAGNNATIVSGTASSSGGGHTIQEDDVGLEQRTNLNFVGGLFELYDDAGSDATIVSGTVSGLLDDYLLADGSKELTSDWDAGSHKITAEQLESDVGSGTAPFIVASPTLVDNLNADMVDGYHLDQELVSGSSPYFDGSNFIDLHASGVAIADTGSYFTSDEVEGALQELAAISASGSSSGDFHWHLEGALSPLLGVGANWVVPRDGTIEKAIFYVEETGITGSTIVDINKNGGSIFVTPPEIPFNDADGIVTAIPDTLDLSSGDLVTFDIDSAASGSSGLDVYVAMVGGGGGSSSSLTVEEEDGSPSVSDVDTIKFSNDTVTDNGDGSVSVEIGGNSAVAAHFVATMSADQSSISNNTYTKINFDTEELDEGNYYDTTNKRWTPPEGHILIHVMLELYNRNSSGYSVSIYKNGSQVSRSVSRDAESSAYNHSLETTYTDKANGTDYYEVYIWHWNASTLYIESSGDGSRFEGMCFGL